MAKDKVSMPSGGAGITRYFDDSPSKLRFKPGHVIVISVVVIVLTVLLHAYGNSILSTALGN